MTNTGNSPLWIFAIPIAIGVLIVIWSMRYAKKRAEEFARMAQQLGFTFLGKTWRGPVLSPLYKTCILQRTRGRFNNAMVGSVGGMDVAMFDYAYQMGKSTTTLTLVAFTHHLQLPPFELRSESILDKISDAFMHNDIDFDSNPEFSKRYFLRSPDEAGIRGLFNPGLIAYFEQIPPDKQWHIESSANTLIVYRFRQLMKAAEIPPFLDGASAIARTVLGAAH